MFNHSEWPQVAVESSAASFVVAGRHAWNPALRSCGASSGWAAGAAHALLGRPGRREGVAVLLYLLLGWCGVVLIVPLAAALSTEGLALLAAVGVLYSAGTAFHLAARLPYHNAAWHACVLAAAACHFAAVLRDIAPAAG